jgi:hypothetical protein
MGGEMATAIILLMCAGLFYLPGNPVPGKTRADRLVIDLGGGVVSGNAFGKITSVDDTEIVWRDPRCKGGIGSIDRASGRVVADVCGYEIDLRGRPTTGIWYTTHEVLACEPKASLKPKAPPPVVAPLSGID